MTPSCMSVFSLVPQTEQLKNEVMHSVIIMIQEDLKPVSRKAKCLGWEGNWFYETLKLYKMERGRFMDEGRGKALLPSSSWPQTFPWVTFGLFKPEKDLRSGRVVPAIF